MEKISIYESTNFSIVFFCWSYALQ